MPLRPHKSLNYIDLEKAFENTIINPDDTKLDWLLLPISDMMVNTDKQTIFIVKENDPDYVFRLTNNVLVLTENNTFRHYLNGMVFLKLLVNQ